MSFRFRTFRRVLLGLIISLCCVSVGLSISIRPILNHQHIFWLHVSIQSACLLRSLWSALRKPLLKQLHSVASETVSLFFLLPFELVFALIVSTSPLEREHTLDPLPLVLRIFILVNTIINLSYTACFLLIALITSAAFDSNIWTRDIDSSPSPFPVPVLVSFVLPCIFRRPPSLASAPTQGMVREPPHPQTIICLPGCQCTSKLYPTDSECPSVGVPTATQSRPLSLSRSLVRIPDAVERRASIIVAFEV
ncbi:hypothetical protein E4T56_gene2130 [Termitomyces sp. T112]|nr:hypothetical protein E4T56_gene2130 [Termitomyces sp. T112]KAH0589147.1 hypothetical protein H2248_004913 [Termitomyces sp. 'cryptogamus']